MLSNTTFYYYYGTFYKEAEEGFTVVNSPTGAVVDALPDGYEVEQIEGTEYYVLDGVYYKEVETNEVEDDRI